MAVKTCFVIGMMDNEISKKYMDVTIPRAESVLGCPIHLFDAVRPGNPIIKNVPFAKYKQPTKGTKGRVLLSETEKAVFCSHTQLWYHILEHHQDDEVWVLEHDAYLPDVVPEFEENTTAIVANGIGSALAYSMRPNVLERLLFEFEMLPRHDWQIDTWMYDWFRRHQTTRKNIINFKAKHLNQFGTTIDHHQCL